MTDFPIGPHTQGREIDWSAPPNHRHTIGPPEPVRAMCRHCHRRIYMEHWSKHWFHMDTHSDQCAPLIAEPEEDP
ncbi:hypothetical protein [Rhodococcus koreensis]